MALHGQASVGLVVPRLETVGVLRLQIFVQAFMHAGSKFLLCNDRVLILLCRLLKRLLCGVLFPILLLKFGFFESLVLFVVLGAGRFLE